MNKQLKHHILCHVIACYTFLHNVIALLHKKKIYIYIYIYMFESVRKLYVPVLGINKYIYIYIYIYIHLNILKYINDVYKSNT